MKHEGSSNVRTRSRIGWLVVALALAASSAFAQTLGDVAKQEAARRKASGASAAKVYTNDDLKAAPAPAAAAPTAPAPAAEAAAAADTKKADEKKAAEDDKGESYWRGRMAQAREELRRNEMFRDALQTKINSLSNDFAARDDPAQRAQLANDRQQALAEQARVTGEIEKNRKAIADMEEEGRQAGVPPGWLR
jgi:hypothetical protein